MIDRLFAAVLTFSILIGTTFAFGNELFNGDPAASVDRTAPIVVRHVELERVVVTAKRAPAATSIATDASSVTLAN